MPRSWTCDAARMAEAGIAGDTAFATKPQLARTMTGRAVAAGLPFAWLTADEAYGDNGPLRAWLEEAKLAYVRAVSCDHRVPAGAGRTIRADHLAAAIEAGGWARMSCGRGSTPRARLRNSLPTHSDPAQDLVPLSVNEIRRLHAVFARPPHDPAHHWRWSRWRRRHRAIARNCHYQRRCQRGY